MHNLEGVRCQAVISCSASGDNIIIPAPGVGQYIAIDFIAIIPNSAVAVTFKSGTTAITGLMSLSANQGLVFDNASKIQEGILKKPTTGTVGNAEAFILNLGGAVQVSGTVSYRIVGYSQI